MQNFPLQTLKRWFNREKRSLPWRENPTPYRVLVSEIMLQQTQAGVVEPYFIRWMQQFPTLEALASADEQILLKAWEGLGYYSRARNLKKAALAILEGFSGKVPEEEEVLVTLPGIGPYTAAAIAAFAYQKKALAIDGNVLRVASRFFLLEEAINTPQGYKKVKEQLLFCLDDEEPWVISEALIELGATLCTKTPSCARCPLSEGCLAYQKKEQHLFPKKKKGAAITLLEREVLILRKEGDILLSLPQEKGIMQGLYEFPYFPKEEKSKQKLIEGQLWQKSFPPLIQSFTRFRVTLYPSLWKVIQKQNFDPFVWVDLKVAKTLPFSSAHKKILQQLE